MVESNPQKVYGFGLRAFKKFPELIPLCSIVGFAVVMFTGYGLYSFTKTDVIVNKKNALPPWERVDLENPKPGKLLTFNQTYEKMPELKALKKEISE